MKWIPVWISHLFWIFEGSGALLPLPLAWAASWEFPAQRYERVARQLQDLAPPVNAHSLYRRGDFNHSCVQGYRKLYAQPVVNVHIAFGYKDWRPMPFVSDSLERAALSAQLLKPCQGTLTACGFTLQAGHGEQPGDIDTLTKTVTAPDGTARLMRIFITHSSLSTDDNYNKETPLQARQSKVSRANFVNGLISGDVVFYLGHSRLGGGPDFDPPRLRRDLQVDFAWYQRARPGEATMYWAIKQRPPMNVSGLSLLGVLSCETGTHFLRELRGMESDLGVLYTKTDISLDDENDSLFGALNGLTGLWCEESFERAVQAPLGSGTLGLEGFL